MVDFSEVFKYDETSSTYLKWISDYRKGRGGKPVRRINNSDAGNITSEGRLVLTYNGKVYSVNQVVWELLKGPIPRGRSVMSKDGNPLNCNIDNLELNVVIDKSEYKYGQYLSEFFYYDEESASGLRWKRVYGKARTKCFSVNVYGYELAEHLAKEYRLHQIDLLNLMDAGYTDRHGT